MTPVDLNRVAGVVRAVAKEIESGRWLAVAIDRQNHHRDRPRMSWQPYQGVDITGSTFTVRLHGLKSGHEQEGKAKAMGKRFIVIEDEEIMCWFDTESDAVADAKARAAVHPEEVYSVAEIIGQATAKKERRPVTYTSLRKRPR